MLRHSVCGVEFGASDLERAADFYQGVLGWTVSSEGADSLIFRSADGLAGVIRRTESSNPSRLPLLKVEVEEYGLYLELAARHNGGYTGFVDPIQGEWTVNLRDPDGNLIRLERAAGAPSRIEIAEGRAVTGSRAAESSPPPAGRGARSTGAAPAKTRADSGGTNAGRNGTHDPGGPAENH